MGNQGLGPGAPGPQRKQPQTRLKLVSLVEGEYLALAVVTREAEVTQKGLKGKS